MVLAELFAHEAGHLVLTGVRPDWPWCQAVEWRRRHGDCVVLFKSVATSTAPWTLAQCDTDFALHEAAAALDVPVSELWQRVVLLIRIAGFNASTVLI